MQTRLQRLLLLGLGFLSALTGAAQAEEKELRAGWLAFVQPALAPQNYPTSFHHHRAREQAVSLLEPAAKGKDPLLLESLGYFYLRDFQYRKASEQFQAALRHNSRDPRPHYLLGQTKAILLAAEPLKMREQVKEAVEEFRRAAGRDADNAMPLLQAASIALDCDRADLALPLVAEALKRPAYRLYVLPVPQDLVSNPVQASEAWWWVHSELWGEMLTRASNCARGLLKQADRQALRGETEQANRLYQQGLEIGALLCRGDPPLAIALAAGLEMERQALAGRASLQPPETQEIRERLSRVESAQRRLEKEWAALQERERAQLPGSVEFRLKSQKSLVEIILSSL